jgi:hypothetical protein
MLIAARTCAAASNSVSASKLIRKILDMMAHP